MAEQRPNADLDAAMGFTPQTNLPQTSADLGDAHQAAQKATQSSMAAAAVEITSAKIDIEKATVTVPPLPAAEKPPDLSGITSPRPPTPSQAPAPVPQGVQTGYRESESTQRQVDNLANFLPDEFKRLASALEAVFSSLTESFKTFFNAAWGTLPHQEAPKTPKEEDWQSSPPSQRPAAELQKSWQGAKQGAGAAMQGASAGMMMKGGAAGAVAGAGLGMLEEATSIGEGKAAGLVNSAAISAVAPGLMPLFVASIKATEAIEGLAKKSLDLQRHFEQASASMAVVFAEMDLRQFRREQMQGEQLANSARDLMEAQQDLADHTGRVTTAFTRIENTVLAFMARMTTKFAELVLDPLSNALEGIADKLEGKTESKTLNPAQWYDEVARIAARNKMNNNPRPIKFKGVGKPEVIGGGGDFGD